MENVNGPRHKYGLASKKSASQKFACARDESLRDFLVVMITMTTRDKCGIYQGGARFHPSIAVTLDRDQCRNVRAKLWKKSPSSGSLKATFIISDPGTAA